jgi:hypothetical protein
MSTYITQQHVPFVPRSVSVPLVAAAPLAAKLASATPELIEVSKSAFEETRNNDLKNLEAEEVQSEALRGVLDLYVLNMQALFMSITTSLQLRGQYEQLIAETDVQTTESLNQIDSRRLLLANVESEVRQIAADLELPKALYSENLPIEPAALFEACLFRLQYWQQKWQEHCFKAIEIDLKSQRDAVLGAVTDCLVTLCEDGVNNIISFEPTPQSQEDVYLALYEAMEHPFSGAWPKIITETRSETDKNAALTLAIASSEGEGV